MEFEFLNLGMEAKNNELTDINFVSQAIPKKLLTNKIDNDLKNCINKKSMLMTDDFINDNYLKGDYLMLYDYLVKNKIILKKFKKESVITLSYVYTVNKELLEKSDLKTLLDSNNADFPERLKCYNINYAELKKFLKDYVYSASDHLKVLVVKPKGGNRSKKQNKTGKRLRKQNKTGKRLRKQNKTGKRSTK